MHEGRIIISLTFQASMKVEKPQPKIEINYFAILLYILTFFVIQFRNFFVFLTRFYPFSSLVGEEWLLHYKNKPVNDVLDEMSKILWKTGLSFSNYDNGVDENFVYLEGKFERFWKGTGVATAIKYLKEKFGEDFVYITKLEKGSYKIMVSRSKLT